MTSLSPYNCVSSFRYGVSPQPAHAPEYSKSGWANWLLLTSGFNAARSGLGSARKNSYCLRSFDLSGITAMFSALWLAFDLSLAGQTVAQSVQPVQSSGATWMVYTSPLVEPRNFTLWKPSGAAPSSSWS